MEYGPRLLWLADSQGNHYIYKESDNSDELKDEGTRLIGSRVWADGESITVADFYVGW